MTAHRVVALGELLLRLKSPGHERLLQSGTLEAVFGGAEANVLGALANDGVDVAYVTALPDNVITDAAIGELRRNNIDTSGVVRTAGRLGTYYLEAGAGQRPGRVVYDREFSSFATVQCRCLQLGYMLRRRNMVAHHRHHARVEHQRGESLFARGENGARTRAHRFVRLQLSRQSVAIRQNPTRCHAGDCVARTNRCGRAR